MSAPLLVLDDRSELEAVVTRLRDAGHRVTTSWSLPPEPWAVGADRIICCGVVADVETARAAVLAAARGAGVVAAIAPDAPVADVVIADLNRIGPVKRHRRERVALTDEQRRLLSLLAEGSTLPDAARTLLLSMRTTERRLAGARRLLGTRSTAEAIVRFVELGDGR